MEPLQSIPMPSHAVLIGLNSANSWPTGDPARPTRLAYIATNSTQRLAFVTLASHTANVLRVATRPSNFDDMPYGVVVELSLAQDLGEGEAIYLSLAQAGATTYYPPQQIDDGK